MRELLDKIETRQQLVEETIGQLREQIAHLTEQLGAAERTLERLQITRETVLELASEDGTLQPAPLRPGYGEIVVVFEQAGEGLRSKDVCQALGLGAEPRHTESIRAKLKRLVSRGILTEPEPEPGLFSLNQPTKPTPPGIPT